MLKCPSGFTNAHVFADGFFNTARFFIGFDSKVRSVVFIDDTGKSRKGHRVVVNAGRSFANTNVALVIKTRPLTSKARNGLADSALGRVRALTLSSFARLRVDTKGRFVRAL